MRRWMKFLISHIVFTYSFHTNTITAFYRKNSCWKFFELPPFFFLLKHAHKIHAENIPFWYFLDILDILQLLMMLVRLDFFYWESLIISLKISSEFSLCFDILFDIIINLMKNMQLIIIWITFVNMMNYNPPFFRSKHIKYSTEILSEYIFRMHGKVVGCMERLRKCFAEL